MATLRGSQAVRAGLQEVSPAPGRSFYAVLCLEGGAGARGQTELPVRHWGVSREQNRREVW